MAEANKSYAVYGNAGLQTATLIPDLTQAVDSNFLKIEQNVASLNCWQPTFTSNLISETKRQEEFCTSISGDFAYNSQLVANWDFYLKGWTQVKNIVLQYVLALASNTNPNSSETGLGFGMALPSSMEQSEYTWLDILEEMEIKLGNNSYVITSNEIHNRFGIKHLALSTKKTVAEASLMANFGLQAARTSGLIFYEDSYSTIPQPYLALPISLTNSDTYCKFSIDTYGKYYDHAFCNLASTNVYADLPNSQFIYQPKIFSLPLSMTHSFFSQENTWLPKGLRIQIKIIFSDKKINYAGGMSLKAWKTKTTSALGETAKLIINKLAVGSVNGFYPNMMKLIYEYSDLKYEIQEDLKKMWLERPFLYNYYEWDRYVSPILTNTTRPPYIFDFKQNSQRPLDIWIYIRNEGENQQIARYYESLQNIERPFWLQKYSLTPVIYESIKVFINGQEIYNVANIPFLNLDSTQVSDGLTPDDVLNSLIAQKCDNETGLDTSNVPISRQINFDNIYPYRITLAPNNFFQRGTYPVDKGACNVRLEITPRFLTSTAGPGLISSWLNYSNARMFIYARRGAQLTLDASHNCTNIQWPLVVTNNTTVATPTINTN